MPGRRERRWRWFVSWMLTGACLAFGVTAIGVFVVPVGLLLAVALARRRRGVDVLGLLAGVGVIVAWIGSINLNYHDCASNSVSVSLRAAATRSVVYSCGGVNGVPWMIVGVSAILIALVAYHVTTRSARPASPGPNGAQPLPS